MLKCGLLGKVLGHSYSPAIHKELGEYEYLLYEKTEEELEDFLKNGDWNGLNVTIPYKKTVFPYCAEISETARKAGSVNTLIKRADGSIFGDNTDVYGFYQLVVNSGIDIKGEKALILGSGGASRGVSVALEMLGAEYVVISRTGENNYTNLDRHADARVIVNTTPVGMYPDNLNSPLNLSVFPELKAVFDVVYNPSVTGILLQAEEMNIPCANGLYMLVAQAKKSSEEFMDAKIPDERIDEITKKLESGMKNIVIIGMPGSGKSTVSKILAEKTGRKVIDSDAYLVEKAGMSIPEIFEKYGEEHFRALETEVYEELGKASGTIISTGGGCVTRDRNYPLLHQNGIIIWITRDTSLLPIAGRPLSKTNDLNEMYKVREPLYRKFSDMVVDNDRNINETIDDIMKILA